MTVMTEQGPLTIQLSGVGRIPATPAGAIERGGTLLWGTNLTYTVEHVEPRGTRAVAVLQRHNIMGVTGTVTMPAHRAVAYYSAAEALERGLRGIDAVDDIDAVDLYDHIGREISTPDGWHVLASIREHATGVHAIIAGNLHRVELHFDQLVGVRGDRVAVEPCGCLTLNIEVLGHHPSCKRSEKIQIAGSRGWEYISDGSSLLGCKGCRFRWNKAGYYDLVLTGISPACPYHCPDDEG